MAALVGLALCACTRASEERPREQQRPEAQPAPAPVLAKALSIDVTSFAPTRADHSGVLVRFDRIRKAPLGAATEKLLRFLPDHRRVVGNTAHRTIEAFDLVLITSSNPSLITTTNMSARMAIAPKRMRTMLDNNLSPTTWSAVRGGAVGRFGTLPGYGIDPRVYLMLSRQWIVLTQPSALATLLDKRSGDLDRFGPPQQLPPWLTKLPALMQIGRPATSLIALATLNSLPTSMALPVLGTITMPRRATAALERFSARRVDVFSGELFFDSATTAAAFYKTLAGVRAVLASYKPQPGDPAVALVNAVKRVRLKLVSARIQFALTAQPRQTVELVDYCASLLAGWAAATPPTVP